MDERLSLVKELQDLRGGLLKQYYKDEIDQMEE